MEAVFEYGYRLLENESKGYDRDADSTAEHEHQTRVPVACHVEEAQHLACVSHFGDRESNTE